MSFYRIYRPQVIDEIDNPSIREQLSSLLSKDRKKLPHAYFLTGPKGTGKTTAARVIAKLFNCASPIASGPCGSCEQCKSIANGTSMDVVEMDAASNRGIDEIRSLRDRISMTPVSAPYTVYIIDEVHMLTTEAFNALLKTLEEPPPHAVFVLATTDAHKVPGTILSRCMRLTFSRAGIPELTHVLTRIAKDEKMTIDDDAVARIAETADGSFRDAVKLLEQVSFHKGKITEEIVRQSLNLSDGAVRKLFVSHLSRRDAKAALALIGVLVHDGRDVKEFMIDVLGDLHALLLAAAGGESQEEDEWSRESLIDGIRRISVAFTELRYSPVPTLPLELAVVEFCAGDSQSSARSGQEVSVVVPPKSVHKDPVIPVRPASAPVSQPVTSAAARLQKPVEPESPPTQSLGLLTLEKLTEHWPDVIASLNTLNHSVAGILRSSRPKAVEDGIVTIEAFYKFHQEKLSDIKAKQLLCDMLKKLFGEKVSVEIVLGKK